MSILLHDHLKHGLGIYSVCSAHPLVVRAAAEQAAEDGTLLLIEATSNQVNQFGGYTGMQPADFRSFVFQYTDAAGLDPAKVVLGGDHLGPNPWRGLHATEAMQHAVAMVEQYVKAGFTKIHLDCSMSCEGDPSPLPDETVAARAAQMCAAAEAVRTSEEPLLYVIGTEVPVPGGATHAVHELPATSPQAAATTLDIHQRVFSEHGLAAVWPRVIALVVQPGVEFDHEAVIDYDRAKAAGLTAWLHGSAQTIVFEAHSTDYQKPAAYKHLVQDGFAILKVGPALTFALREGLNALEDIERELVPAQDRSGLWTRVEAAMLARPGYWQPYYEGSEEQQRLLRQYSYSDRVRYYWNDPQVNAAVEHLYANLAARPIPETMLSRYLPAQYKRLREVTLATDPQSLLVDKVRDVLREYAAGCRPGAHEAD